MSKFVRLEGIDNWVNVDAVQSILVMENYLDGYEVVLVLGSYEKRAGPFATKNEAEEWVKRFIISTIT